MHQLLAIVAVEKEDRVQCQQLGCGKGVYARIHVVNEDGKLTVLGSDCYSKRFGVTSTTDFKGLGGGSGQKLSDEERQLLVENTTALIAKLTEDHEREMAAARAKLAALKAAFQLRQQGPAVSPAPYHSEISPPDSEDAADHSRNPPEWAKLQKKNTSLFAYGLSPGEGFVLIQSATHEGCFIAPIPGPFEGWDEALPPSLGALDSAQSVYVSSLSISSLAAWFVSRCKKGSRIDSNPLAIEDFGLSLSNQ